MADIFVVRPHPTSWKSIKIKPNISQRRWNSACYKTKRFEISSNFLSQFLEVSPSLSWNGEVNFFVNPMPVSVCLSLHVCPFCVSVVHTWTYICLYIYISVYICIYFQNKYKISMWPYLFLCFFIDTFISMVVSMSISIIVSVSHVNIFMYLTHVYINTHEFVYRIL